MKKQITYAITALFLVTVVVCGHPSRRRDHGKGKSGVAGVQGQKA